MQLYDVEAPYLLLFFYEPGCPHCKQAITKLSHSSGFRRLLDKQLVKILAVYPFGDRALWEAYLPEIPETWMNAIVPDASIIKQNTYDIKATPTIYLLDEHKEVLLKDSDLSQVALFFSTNQI